jgi:hypothetical protein
MGKDSRSRFGPNMGVILSKRGSFIDADRLRAGLFPHLHQGVRSSEIRSAMR